VSKENGAMLKGRAHLGRASNSRVVFLLAVFPPFLADYPPSHFELFGSFELSIRLENVSFAHHRLVADCRMRIVNSNVSVARFFSA
jgi:hypothetical protein